MKKLLIALFVFTSLLSCKESVKTDNKFTITVTGQEHFPEGAKVEMLRLKAIESPESVEFLKVEAFKNGKFVLEGIVDDVHMIALNVIPADSKYPIHRIMFPLEPGATKIDFTSMKTFTYKGGKYGEIVINTVNNNAEYQKAWKHLMDYKVTDREDKAQHDKYFEYNDKVNKLKQELLAKAVKSTEDPLAKLLVYESGYYGEKDADRDSVIEDLVMRVGDEHRQSKVAMLGVKKRRERIAAKKAVGVGAIIKDFEAKDLEGETFHLAEVLKQNKYVLVEFWASWCGPCRGEIPHMKKAYGHFKDKGFEIVSFTLDNKKEQWEKASKEEEIPWINTGDLLAYTSPVVKMYGVSGVPANYLVEASTGKIIAKNLRGEKLDEKLEELLKK